MLAAEQRLRRRGDFTTAVRAGRRAGRGALVVHVCSVTARQIGSTAQPTGRDSTVGAGDVPSSRVGFVVPRAVGSAVIRNKVRRRLRHLMRDRLLDLPAGTDVVVRVLPGAASRSYEQLGLDLNEAIAAARRGSDARGSRDRRR